MMLSYFNIGVQQEHLKRYSDCEVSYNRSRIIANIINDKGILKRLTKTQSMHNAGKGTSSSMYDKSGYSTANNNSKGNLNSMRGSRDNSNYPNFSLYNNDYCEIK